MRRQTRFQQISSAWPMSILHPANSDVCAVFLDQQLGRAGASTWISSDRVRQV